MKKLKVIKKIIKSSCYCCSTIGGRPIPQKECKTCDGTGFYKENYYTFITTNSKGQRFAIDSDTLS